jgi:hypothetical protein
MLINDGEEIDLNKGDKVGVVWDRPSTNQLTSKSQIVAGMVHYDPIVYSK